MTAKVACFCETRGASSILQGPNYSDSSMLGSLLGSPDYLEGQGDLISRLIMGKIRVTIWVIGVINLLTKSP